MELLLNPFVVGSPVVLYRKKDISYEGLAGGACSRKGLSTLVGLEICSQGRRNIASVPVVVVVSI